MIWLENLAVKFLMKRGTFTKIGPDMGKYYEDGFDVKNGSKETCWILVVKEE